LFVFYFVEPQQDIADEIGEDEIPNEDSNDNYDATNNTGIKPSAQEEEDKSMLILESTVNPAEWKLELERVGKLTNQTNSHHKFNQFNISIEFDDIFPEFHYSISRINNNKPELK
jgi:hypothetical protein